MFRVLDQAGIYILLALGLNIVVGYAGLLDLGYVAFYAIGAYSYALLASPQLGLHVPFWLVLPVAPLLAALSGVLLGAPTLRLRGDYLAIVTLGFGEVIRILLNNLDVITNGPRGVTNIDPATLDPAHLDPKSVATAKLLLYPPLPDLIHNLPLTLSSPDPVLLPDPHALRGRGLLLVSAREARASGARGRRSGRTRTRRRRWGSTRRRRSSSPSPWARAPRGSPACSSPASRAS